jgi:hypothetical protein
MSIGIADVYTSSTQDETKAVDLIRRALDLGIISSIQPTSTVTRRSRSAKRFKAGTTFPDGGLTPELKVKGHRPPQNSWPELK